MSRAILTFSGPPGQADSRIPHWVLAEHRSVPTNRKKCIVRIRASFERTSSQACELVQALCEALLGRTTMSDQAGPAAKRPRFAFACKLLLIRIVDLIDQNAIPKRMPWTLALRWQSTLTESAPTTQSQPRASQLSIKLSETGKKHTSLLVFFEIKSANSRVMKQRYASATH
jgi:hypothetical protein